MCSKMDMLYSKVGAMQWRSGCLFIKLDLYLVKYVCHIVEWLSYAHTHSKVDFFQ